MAVFKFEDLSLFLLGKDLMRGGLVVLWESP